MELTKTKLFYFGAAIVLIIAGYLIYRYGFDPTPLARGAIKVWGFEDENIYKYSSFIKDFNARYPRINIDYIRKSPQNYERELLNALASGQGPDVFPIYHTWVSNYQDKIVPLPGDLMSFKDYYDIFVDVASQDFVVDGSIWAVPFYVDTLALYWNKDFFNAAGIAQPPATWDKFLEAVKILTLRDANGNIVRAGTAMGAGANVDHASDILLLLMLQNGTTMLDSQTGKAIFNQSRLESGQNYNPGEDALRFYTDFANSQKEVYTWNSLLGNSTDAFSAGRAATMINYSSAASEISQKTPYLNFAIAPVPQIKEGGVAVNYADYWGEAVWTGSKNQRVAWLFVLWQTSSDVQKSLLQMVKKPASRRDVITWQKGDPVLGVFASQALSARSWPQFDHVAISNIFTQMIDSVVMGQATTVEALGRAVNQLNAFRK
ncbi:MAG: sugar ABC transporter substrate-binding protein [Candidatus Portnoybacteria bacterium]|nr:sugar ABC transporter substrate-binding protein [Candidatus Portnoybacteria bacterium]